MCAMGRVLARAPGATAAFWHGRIEGRFVEGADRLRFDGEGKVRE